MTNAPPLVGTLNRFVLKEIRFLGDDRRDHWIAIGVLGIARASGFLR